MLTLPPEIARQASKTACFQQLFQREAELQALQEASDLQAAWMNGGMTLNEVLYGLAAGQAATALRPFGGGRMGLGLPISKRMMLRSGDGVGMFLSHATAGMTGDLGPRAGSFGASMCSDYLDKLWNRENTPPPPISGVMPPDASVPGDPGGPVESGGGTPGICLPPAAPGSSVIVPREETMGNCL